jgi:hypothetical protein
MTAGAHRISGFLSCLPALGEPKISTGGIVRDL